jgi:hypothetical protein
MVFWRCQRHVCLYPESGAKEDIPALRIRATTGPSALHQNRSYSITSSAVASNVAGTVRPSHFALDVRALSERASRIIVTHLVGAAGRKRIEADIIAGPAWSLESGTFSAATGAACAGTQFVA